MVGWLSNLTDKKVRAPRSEKLPAKPPEPPPIPETLALPSITARQIRAARALLKMEQIEIAAAAGIARPVYNRIETGKVRGRAETLDKIEKAFKDAGVQLIYADAMTGEGVRMADPAKEDRE